MGFINNEKLKRALSRVKREIDRVVIPTQRVDYKDLYKSEDSIRYNGVKSPIMELKLTPNVERNEIIENSLRGRNLLDEYLYGRTVNGENITIEFLSSRNGWSIKGTWGAGEEIFLYNDEENPIELSEEAFFCVSLLNDFCSSGYYVLKVYYIDNTEMEFTTLRYCKLRPGLVEKISLIRNTTTSKSYNSTWTSQTYDWMLFEKSSFPDYNNLPQYNLGSPIEIELTGKNLFKIPEMEDVYTDYGMVARFHDGWIDWEAVVGSENGTWLNESGYKFRLEPQFLPKGSYYFYTGNRYSNYVGVVVAEYEISDTEDFNNYETISSRDKIVEKEIENDKFVRLVLNSSSYSSFSSVIKPMICRVDCGDDYEKNYNKTIRIEGSFSGVDDLVEYKFKKSLRLTKGSFAFSLGQVSRTINKRSRYDGIGYVCRVKLPLVSFKPYFYGEKLYCNIKNEGNIGVVFSNQGSYIEIIDYINDYSSIEEFEEWVKGVQIFVDYEQVTSEDYEDLRKELDRIVLSDNIIKANGFNMELSALKDSELSEVITDLIEDTYKEEMFYLKGRTTQDKNGKQSVVFEDERINLDSLVDIYTDANSIVSQVLGRGNLKIEVSSTYSVLVTVGIKNI